MRIFILDAHPIMVLFQQQPGWEKVEQLFEEDRSKPKRFLMSLINWGEVYYSFFRSDGEDVAESMVNGIDRLNIEVVAPDHLLTRQAAIYKAGGGLSYADCFAAALAKRERAIFVTGDPEFKRLEKTKEIEIFWV